MKHTHSIFKTLLNVVIMFSVIAGLGSCKKQVDLETINLMVDSAEKDEQLLYYYFGLKKDHVLVATDTFYINREAKSKFSGKKEIIPLYMGRYKNYEMAVDDYRGARVFTGDSLLILGGFKHEVLANGKENDWIQVRIIRDGKKVADGWNMFSIDKMAPPNATFWSEMFSNSFEERIEFIASIILIALIVLVVYCLWKLIYWIIVDKIRGNLTFWDDKPINFQNIFFILCACIGLVFFILQFDESLTYTMRFNPDFFAHWSEYPLILKLLPIIAALWAFSAVAMLIEMVLKLRSLWLIIYYPGKLALGFLLTSATIGAGWLIVIVLPCVIAMVVAMGFGAADSMTGGALSKGSDVPMRFYDDKGGVHRSANERNSANKRIDANKNS